jgi:hypothetical protein
LGSPIRSARRGLGSLRRSRPSTGRSARSGRSCAHSLHKQRQPTESGRRRSCSSATAHRAGAGRLRRGSVRVRHVVGDKDAVTRSRPVRGRPRPAVRRAPQPRDQESASVLR